MNDIIKIDINEKQEQIVSARELHQKLGISKDFTSWFKYQIEKLCLSEGLDFTPILGTSTGGRPSVDYTVSLDIAKHLAMTSGGEKAHAIRQYFIEVEKAWNSPEQIMARALQVSNKVLLEYKEQLAQTQLKLDHKQEVINGLTQDVTITTKKDIINRVVRFKGSDYQLRYRELYKCFKETHHIDLQARREGYNLKQPKIKDKLSVIQYAEKFGHINELYDITCSLYESDVNDIKKILNLIS